MSSRVYTHVYESDKWSSQWISNLSSWNKEAWKKIQDFNGMFMLRLSSLFYACDCGYVYVASKIFHWK